MEKSERAFWPRSADWAWLVAASLAFVGLDISLYVFGEPTTGWAGPAAGVTLQVLLDLSLILLFRFPRLVAGLIAAGALVMLASDLLDPGLLVPTRQLTVMTVPTITPVVLSQLARVLDRRTVLWLTALLVVCASRPWNPNWSTTPFGLLGTALPTALSLYFEARRQLLKSLRDRAERAEREQHLLAERARAEERRKLAEEMHDVVTHRLSLMVLHAGALGVTSDDEAVRTSAEDIRREGALALDELRDLVGVLRNGANAEPRTLHPGAADDPATLVAESASVGIPTELTVLGTPGRISPTVARTAYRVVQEALTNIRKHAPGSTATVELRYHSDGLDVAVENTRAGAPPDPALAGSGSGAGLAGLRQRVELIGGRFDAGPNPGGGYRVDAILPAYVPTVEPTEGETGDPRGRCR